MTEQDQNKTKKQVPLRLSKTLFDELSAWAQDDFRSLNGQIEYLLTEAVRKRRKKGCLTPLSPCIDWKNLKSRLCAAFQIGCG